MRLTAEEIAKLVGGHLSGDGATIIDSVASLRKAGPQDLTYAEEKFHEDAERSSAGCILLRSGEFRGKTLIHSSNPKLAFARAAAVLLRTTEDPRSIHPTAIIAENVHIGVNVGIGPGVVIEPGVSIDDQTVIEAGCYVGRNSKIGTACHLHPRVVIYGGVSIGNRVIIHAGAVVGADGFGFVRDGAAYVKFPQNGQVQIEDDVEIGANTCIDRGSLEMTIVRRGSKLDNLIQVAHNVEIGENTVIAAQTGISGSSTIGPNSIIGGQAGIGEHASLEHGTVLGGQAGVLNSKRVKGGEILWGTPARPLREFLKLQAYIARLPQLFEEFRQLRSKIGSSGQK